MSELNVHVKILRAGQPRPYADSFFEAEIAFTGNPATLWDPPQETVEQIASLLVRRFDKKAGEQREWHETYLKEIRKLGRGCWKVVIIEPYGD